MTSSTVSRRLLSELRNHLCCNGRVESCGRFAKDGEVTDGRAENGVHLDVCQAAAVGVDVAGRLTLTDDNNRPDLGRSELPSRQHNHNVDLAGRQPQFSHDVFGPVGDVGETRKIVGDICLPAEDASRGDRHLSPCFGVDDEETTGTDHDMVDLGATACPRPSAVVKEGVAGCGQWGETARNLTLSTGGDHPSLGGLAGLSSKPFMLSGLRLQPPTLHARGVPGRTHGVSPNGRHSRIGLPH